MITEQEMIQHLENTGWQKCQFQNAWKKKNWKQFIVHKNYELTFSEWDHAIVGRHSIWELTENSKELDPEGFYVANLKKAYQLQLKIDSEELVEA
jgi:hypothetical protein